MLLPEQSFGRLARHNQFSGVVKQQYGLLQPLKQLIDVAAQFQSVLLRALILFTQQTEFRLNRSEFSRFVANGMRGRVELTGANQVDLPAHSLQRIQKQPRQHRSQERGDKERCAECQSEIL